MIKELIDKYLQSEAQTKKKEKELSKKLNVFYPSSAGQCIRKLWNEQKTPVEFPPEVYKRFLIGNLVHDWVQSKILPEFDSEVRIVWKEGDLEFHGRIDSWDKKNNVLYEFKTISALSYVTNKPKPEHVAQLNMYLHATGITKGVIIYLTKNEVDIIEHIIDYDPELYKETVKEFRKVYKALVNNKEPKPNSCKTPWSCEYCRADMVKKRAIIKAVKAKRERESKSRG